MYSCHPSDEISKVFDNGNVRVKRKYGKLKRKVIVIDNKRR